MVTSQRDRRGRLVIHATASARQGEGEAAAVRIVLTSEILSSYRTATQLQRARAHECFEQWLRERLKVHAGPKEVWVIKPEQLFEAEE